MTLAVNLENRPILKNEFYTHVIEGLTAERKRLHPKYFYDAQGSKYFDQICQLDEYYPCKTELNLLPIVAKDIARFLKNEYTLIEFGAGSLQKVVPLLSYIKGLKQFIPIDISGEHLDEACEKLQPDFPNLDILPIAADFTKKINIPKNDSFTRMGFFPGSTIGNLQPSEAVTFLKTARNTLGDKSYLLLGVDTKKSPSILHQAYNDPDGVTAKFNLNILERINRHFDSDIDLEKFEHYAFYNANKGCIEMHLIVLESQDVYLDSTRVHFERGESIHTECSYKYTPAEFATLASEAGWQRKNVWQDSGEMFSIILLQSH